MRRIAAVAFSLLIAIASRAATPTLRVKADDGGVALAITAVKVHVAVRGHLARTTFDLTYRNDLDRITGGNFTFPLPADSELSELGLYFDGRLRLASAVERVQARAAYEETVHRRVDPALAEWSAGRAFSFNVYPIPAKGTKVVHIAYDQELGAAQYTLDLRYGNVDVADVTIDADDARVEAEGIRLERNQAHVAKGKLDGVIRITPVIPPDTALVAFSNEDKLWYLSAAVPVSGTARAVSPASHVALLWDASGSATQRDDAKLAAFIDAFLARQDPNVTIDVVPFHIGVDAPLRGITRTALPLTLASIPNAGATNLRAALEAASAIGPDTRVVLVTDGIDSLGTAAMPHVSRPLTVVNASASADEHHLRAIATSSGGWMLDLSTLSVDDAVDRAMQQPATVAIESGSPQVRDVEPASIVTTANVTITVNARSKQRITAMPLVAGTRRELRVREVEPELADLVRRAWARAHLRALVDRAAPADEVLAHGRAFTQLTPRTSLLVLERWWDYEQYGVPMPPDVRAERDAAKREAEERGKSWIPVPVELVGTPSMPSPDGSAWFITGTARTGDSVLPGATITLTAGDMVVRDVTDAHGFYRITLPVKPKKFTLRGELAGFTPAESTFRKGLASGTIADMSLPVSAVAEAITVTAQAPAIEQDNSNVAARHSSFAARSPLPLADRLLATLADARPLDSDDPAIVAKSIGERHATIAQVVAKMRSLPSADDQFRYYLAARSVIGGDKFFHATAAVALHEISPDLGVRAMTELAEAYPDDAAMLRLIGRVLEGWGRRDLARLLFRRTIELAPRQPQTWRELLLLDATEQRDRDLEADRDAYTRANRDERMEEAATILQNELARKVPDRRLDPNARIQVELMFDANYCYVDLHIIGPSGEEVTWNNARNVADGAKLIGWMTEGFGPEIYTATKPGHYRIDVNNYSSDPALAQLSNLVHVVVYVNGERRDIFTALASLDERVTLGEFDVR